MPAPYDYTLNVGASPVQSLAQGAQIGFGLRQMQDAQAQAEAQRAAQAQMKADLYEASQDISKMPGVMARYPQLADKLKHGWDAMNTAQQQANLAHGGEVLSALQIGRPDVAADVLRNQAAALRNSGDEQGAKLHEAMAQAAETAPDQLKAATALRIAAVPGGDKVIQGIATMGAEKRAEDKAPAELTEAQAKAQSAAVAAKFAESNAVIDLQRKGWDIKKIQEDIDIAKQNSRIAAMNAQTARINSDTQRQELQLKIDEAKQKRDELIRTKTGEAEQGAASIDNALNTIERLKKSPALNDVVGSIEGASYYPTQAAAAANALNPFSSSGDDRADAIALIETLSSQNFLSQVPMMKGTGNLSDAEGKKLEKALQSLSRQQSEKQFRENLDEAARLLNKGRENLSRRTGVPLAKPDTPAAPGARPPLSSFGGG